MKKAIVINPHDDDGVIAIGGLLIQLISKGWKIKYIQLTDGRHGSNIMSPEETKKIRAEEIKKEIEFLGIDSYITLDIEDGTLAETLRQNKDDLVSKVAKEIKEYTPVVVFYPSECEDHSDHRAANQITKKAVELLDQKPAMIRYSVWNIPFKEHKPEYFDKLLAVEIKDEMSKKQEVIKLHKSQEKEGRYSQMVDATNRYLALLYSAYQPFELGKIEILAITKENKNTKELMSDITEYKDVTQMFHGRTLEKIKT